MSSNQAFGPKTIVTDGKRLGFVVLESDIDGPSEQIVSYSDDGHLDYVLGTEGWRAVRVDDVAGSAPPLGTEVVVNGLSGVVLRDRIEFSNGSTMTFEQYAKALS